MFTRGLWERDCWLFQSSLSRYCPKDTWALGTRLMFMNSCPQRPPALRLVSTKNRDLWEGLGSNFLSMRRVIVSYSQPIRFVRLDCEHAQSDEKSVNRGLPALDLPRGRDSWCWPIGARPLWTRIMLMPMPTCLRCTQYWHKNKHKKKNERYCSPYG